MRNDRILIVAAHPDDEILGCAGAVARLVNEGAEAYTLILGEGKTSRQNNQGHNFEMELKELKKEAINANLEIGVKEVFFENFPDNRFDSIDLIDIVKSIENIKKEIKPNIIFTHFMNDLNIDHKITYQAVLTASRPVDKENVKEIYSFEVLSSTEWNYPLTFSPNVFINITSTFDKKIQAMKAYASELRDYPHSRSLRAIEENARIWACKNGIDGFAEAFYLNRKIV